MRKQTKLVAVLSAAALVALGASMTSMASGWVQQDGMWYYEDANGDYVTGEWKRSGDNYFYLGWDGYMLTNQLIEHGDNYYYVDANGAMVKNQWIAVATEDDANVDHRWYRFGPTGRAFRGANGFRKVTIEGKKYAFDEQGQMLYGWVEEGGNELNDDNNAPMYADYFFGPNDTTTIDGVTYTGGAMVTGWYNYLEGIDEYEDEGRDSLWLYFNPSTGVKVTNKENQRVGSLYYSFDEYGIMNTGWHIATGSTPSDSKYYSGSNQGWRQRNTWVWTVPSAAQSQDDHDNDISRWFYVGADGKVTTGARRINSKWYIFDESGIMKSGLVLLDTDRIMRASTIDGDLEPTDTVDATQDGLLDTDYYEAKDIQDLVIDNDTQGLYYFSNDEENDGSMKTGTNVRIELADGVYTFGFASNGQAFDGVENKKLYSNGVLQTGGDLRYNVAQSPVELKIKKDGVEKTVRPWYVVGPTGTFASNNSTVRDADDNYYAVVDGYIFKVAADDYAAKLAKAIVDLGQGKISSYYVYDETYTNKDGELINDGYRRAEKTDAAADLQVKIATGEYAHILDSWDAAWESSYASSATGSLLGDVTTQDWAE